MENYVIFAALILFAFSICGILSFFCKRDKNKQMAKELIIRKREWFIIPLYGTKEILSIIPLNPKHMDEFGKLTEKNIKKVKSEDVFKIIHNDNFVVQNKKQIYEIFSFIEEIQLFSNPQKELTNM